ncbi:PocR ligand-binding domain-containing protein [Evansella sp. AB-rgal1]|uniref:sensor histidine kinase n=1 Tax=Evansella sp. AB-rgal1 TaxID=3242696 RepID=UPI00359D3A79
MSISTNNYLFDLFEDDEGMENKILSDLSLRTIINTDTLQQIQNKLAELTGISMVTVDYKGKPITKETSFSDFCKFRREVTSCKQSCFFSDAYGGLKAAMKNEPYIYCCPAGLVDCAVPIVIQGQHLGAVLMGQVRVNDVGNLEQLGSFIKEEMKMEDHPTLFEKYMETPLIEIERLQTVASLAHFLVNEMIEKQLALRVEKELKKENNRLLSENLIKDNRINEYKKMEIKKTGIELAPHFLMSVMESINNLSIIESANKTNEMVNLFAQMLKYNQSSNLAMVSLAKEIENVKNYMLIKKMQLGETLELSVTIDCEISNIKIPPLVLFPFIENAVVHGIQARDGEGRIELSIEEKQDDIIIHIKDNGRGMKEEILDKIYGKRLEKNSSNKELIGLNINNTRKRMITMFGEKYDITIRSAPLKGTTVTIILPKETKEE